LQPRSSTLQSSLDRVEREIRDLAVEHAYAFSGDGELLFHTTDEADSQVGFNDAELALLAGAVLTHNHPGGRSFSEEDVTFAMRVGLAEMRVVTARSRYVLRPPTDGWSWLLLKSFPAVVELERHLLQRQLFSEIASGAMSRRQFELAYHHLLWDRLSRRQLIDYSVESW
jgi:hypothetical protein